MWLALSAGDQYTGTAWDSIYTQKGNYSVAELVNMMQFDAMVRALTCACASHVHSSTAHCRGVAPMLHMPSMLVTVSLSITLTAGHWQPRVRLWACKPGGLCERADHSAHQVSCVM